MVRLGRSVGNVSADNRSMKNALSKAADEDNVRTSRFSVEGIKNMTSDKGIQCIHRKKIYIYK